MEKQTPIDRTAAWMGLAAAIGFATFNVLVLVLHLLRSEVSPTERTMSEYALGDYGGLMVAGFFILAGSLLALTVALYRTLSPALRSRRAFALMGLMVAGFALAAFFPTDLKDAPVSTTGIIHDATSYGGIFCGLAGMLILESRMRQDPAWRAVYRRSTRFTLVIIACWTVGFLLIFVDMKGLGQRLFALVGLLWLVYIALCARTVALRGPRTPPNAWESPQ